MSRRTRTAALLSAAALLTGGVTTLGLAPAALADPPLLPALGDLSYSPTSPQPGDTFVVSGTGCIPSLPGANTSAVSGAATPAAAPTVTPADTAVGTVAVTVSGPAGFNSTATVTTSPNGSWSSNSQGSVITLGAAGDYSITATCQLLGVGIATYPSASFTVATVAPPTANPSVTVTPTSTTPGSQVNVQGTGFTGASGVTVSMAGLGSKSATVDSSGGFSGVTFAIPAGQGNGTISGTVTAVGASIPVQNFSVTVTAPQDPGASQDGSVPPAVTSNGSTTTGTSSGGGTTIGSGSGTTYSGTTSTTAAKPTLPRTGSDTLWPGLVGGALLLSGAGLVWVGRRRENPVEAATA